VVNLQSVAGSRSVPLDEFYFLPGETPHIENALRLGELITGVSWPASRSGRNSLYLKLRDRVSYEFALVSVAAALHLEGGRIEDARVALGGVGTRPWRCRDAENQLRGSKIGPEVLRQAARTALRGARPTAMNAFKVQMAERAIERVLGELATAYA
jgi:CO/xanthine dehydrogenase FAD-binding subunit